MEEICQKSQKFTLIDNVLDVLIETGTDFNHIFFVTEKNENTIQTIENTKNDSASIKQTLKKSQKKIQDKEFDDHHELETGFFQDLKDLRPNEAIEVEIRSQKIPLEKPKMFSKWDRRFLKKFDFSQSDNFSQSDAQLIDLTKLLAKDMDVFSQHKYDVGKMQQKVYVKVLPNSTLTEQNNL